MRTRHLRWGAGSTCTARRPQRGPRERRRFVRRAGRAPAGRSRASRGQSLHSFTGHFPALTLWRAQARREGAVTPSLLCAYARGRTPRGATASWCGSTRRRSGSGGGRCGSSVPPSEGPGDLDLATVTCVGDDPDPLYKADLVMVVSVPPEATENASQHHAAPRESVPSRLSGCSPASSLARTLASHSSSVSA